MSLTKYSRTFNPSRSKDNAFNSAILFIVAKDRKIKIEKDSNQTDRSIDKIKAELDENQQKLIKMSFFEQKSHKIIADELEIPLGTVKSRIRAILNKMHKFLS